MVDMMAAALSYAHAGVPVFPCAVGGKAPWTDNGFLDATQTSGRSRPGGSGIRTRTSPRRQGPRPSTYSTSTFATAEPDGMRSRRCGGGPGRRLASATIRTPSGGLHLHYPGTAQRSGSLGDRHLDFRSEGGYVLLPPSLGQTKQYSRRYVLIDQRTTDARAFDWQAARELLAPAAASRRVDVAGTAPAASIEHLVAHVRKQREGNRNNVLYWAANRALDQGGTDLEPLVAAAVAAGLPENEAQRTVDSAVRRNRSTAAPSPRHGWRSATCSGWADDEGRRARVRPDVAAPQCDRLWTVREVSEFLSIPVATLHQWRYLGIGPAAFRVGKHLRYDPDAVREWLTAECALPSFQ